jgi:mannose-6-phosphate isomerase-like protein (cupin superfamily)
MIPTVLKMNDLTLFENTLEFEGALYGNARVSFLLVDMPPGKGSRLHSHPYEEILIVFQGQATFTVAESALDIPAGQVIVVPAYTPHKFINSGEVPLRQIDIHVSPRFITDWLEEQ